MSHVRFTAHLVRYADASDLQADGATLREVVESVLARRPRLRSYLLDDQGGLRKHVSAFVDGEQIRDRRLLTDPVTPTSTIDLFRRCPEADPWMCSSRPAKGCSSTI